MSENEEKQEIIVKVKRDNENPTNDVDVKALEQENEELKEKLDLIAQKEFEKKKNELGCDDPDINDPEKLMAWAKGQKSVKSSGGTAEGGTASLEGNYAAGDSFVKKQFNSPKEMVDELKARMHSPNPEVAAEARSIYEILLQKAIRQGGTGQSEGIGLAELKRKPKKGSD